MTSLTIIVSLAAIEVADVTAGITATAVFFCNVAGASGADVSYFWTQTLNGVFPVDRFPAVIYEDRVFGLRTPTLMLVDWSRTLTTRALSQSVACGLVQELELSHPLVCTRGFLLAL